MWNLPPDERLFLAKSRGAEIREDAHEVRRTHHSMSSPVTVERLRGFHLHLGKLMIVVGRTLREDEGPCPDLVMRSSSMHS
jgi:hypothetical protein